MNALECLFDLRITARATSLLSAHPRRLKYTHSPASRWHNERLDSTRPHRFVQPRRSPAEQHMQARDQKRLEMNTSTNTQHILEAESAARCCASTPQPSHSSTALRATKLRERCNKTTILQRKRTPLFLSAIVGSSSSFVQYRTYIPNRIFNHASRLRFSTNDPAALLVQPPNSVHGQRDHLALKSRPHHFSRNDNNSQLHRRNSQNHCPHTNRGNPLHRKAQHRNSKVPASLMRRPSRTIPLPIDFGRAAQKQKPDLVLYEPSPAEDLLSTNKSFNRFEHTST